MKLSKRINKTESKHLERLIITVIAVFAVLAAMFVKATLLGEFNLLIGQ